MLVSLAKPPGVKVGRARLYSTSVDVLLCTTVCSASSRKNILKAVTNQNLLRSTMLIFSGSRRYKLLMAVFINYRTATMRQLRSTSVSISSRRTENLWNSRSTDMRRRPSISSGQYALVLIR